MLKKVLADITKAARSEILLANLACPQEGLKSGARFTSDPDLRDQFRRGGIHPGILRVAVRGLKFKTRWLEAALMPMTTGECPNLEWSKEKIRLYLGLSKPLIDEELALDYFSDDLRMLVPVRLDPNAARFAVSLVHSDSFPLSFSRSLSSEEDLEGVNFINGCYSFGILWSVGMQLRTVQRDRIFGGTLRSSFEEFSQIKSWRNLEYHAERVDSHLKTAARCLEEAASRWKPSNILGDEVVPTNVLVSAYQQAPARPQLVLRTGAGLLR